MSEIFPCECFVNSGRKTILITMVMGIIMSLILLYVKFENPEAAFTHILNELRYYINCGIVVLICSAISLIAPKHKTTLIAFVSTIPLQLIISQIFPEMNYFVRAGWVILIVFVFATITGYSSGRMRWQDLIQYDSKVICQLRWGC